MKSKLPLHILSTALGDIQVRVCDIDIFWDSSPIDNLHKCNTIVSVKGIYISRPYCFFPLSTLCNGSLTSEPCILNPFKIKPCSGIIRLGCCDSAMFTGFRQDDWSTFPNLTDDWLKPVLRVSRQLIKAALYPSKSQL